MIDDLQEDLPDKLVDWMEKDIRGYINFMNTGDGTLLPEGLKTDAVVDEDVRMMGKYGHMYVVGGQHSTQALDWWYDGVMQKVSSNFASGEQKQRMGGQGAVRRCDVWLLSQFCSKKDIKDRKIKRKYAAENCKGFSAMDNRLRQAERGYSSLTLNK